MDIKDFILVSGGILIIAVVAHGFWIAYRAKKEPYRVDLVSDSVPEDADEIEHLRGELPSGGARLKLDEREVQQANLELELPAPSLMDEASMDVASEDVLGINPVRGNTHITPELAAELAEPKMSLEPDQSSIEAALVAARSADVQLVTPNRRTQERGGRVKSRRQVALASSEPVTEATTAPEELLVLNLLAREGTRFPGEGLVNALCKQGLKYGEMDIFHRIDPSTKGRNFSAANVMEPGTFDLSDLDNLSSPGVSFFMQLPGPADVTAAFEDMLNTAHQIAVDLGGELRDEQLSMLSGQTREHMRQRIADYARRKLFSRTK